MDSFCLPGKGIQKGSPGLSGAITTNSLHEFTESFKALPCRSL